MSSSSPAPLFALNNVAGQIQNKIRQSTAGAAVILPWLLQAGAAVATFAWGWISKAVMSGIVGIAGFLFSQLVQFVTTGVQQILNFNWNQSDGDLNAQFASAQIALASVAGETVGNALGWLVCGAVPGAKIFVFNRDLGLEILRDVGEEGVDEFIGNVTGLTQLTFQTLAGAAAMNILANNRAIFRTVSDAIGTALLFPIAGVDGWKKYRSKAESEGRAVTFADGIETAIENIPDPRLRSAVEGVYDGFFDGCFEAGYVVSNSIESYFSRGRLTKGRVITVEVQPNRKNDREKLLLQGTEAELAEKIPQIMANYQFVDNREFGTVIAAPPEEVLRRRPNARLIKVTLKSTPRPPWKAGVGDGEYKETTVEIPDARRSITWEQVKLACSGANGYLYGRFKAVATLNNYRTMSCYADTESNARERVKAFASLSEAEILFIDVKEEVKEGIRLTNPNLYKDAIRVYPAHFAIMAHEKILGGETGFNTTAGKLRRQRYIIDLWPSTEPDDANELINELFSNQDLNP